jgi:hypothetical protein
MNASNLMASSKPGSYANANDGSGAVASISHEATVGAASRRDNFNRENLLTAVSTIRGASRSVSFF